MSFWTDERIDELHRLAAEGMSGQQIMLAMGAPTRNTILGKASRLGIKLGGIAFGREPPPPGAPSPSMAKRRDAWSDAEKACVQTYGPTNGAKGVAEAIGRSEKSVIAQAFRMRVALHTDLDAPPIPKIERPTIAVPALRQVERRVSRHPKGVKESPTRVAFEAPTNDNVPLPQIRAHQCRWPLGDPRDVDEFRFCGATAALTYCPYHYQLVYRVGTNGSQRERRQMALAAE